ncbi:superinfection immunity protein [Comamonas thiooxydans]|uniref:superinfection immunity protein n=1 Tax=Comamonas thiooxydans TaxID=363952 RepID=UPI000B413749|nr:superinfection immunity protein [Comamonas thiooxydans]
MSNETIGWIFYFGCIGLVLLVNALVYVTPTLIACRYKRANRVPIMLINVLLGWTILGWVLALALALKADPPAEPKTQGQ